jgi:hypothetical protein
MVAVVLEDWESQGWEVGQNTRHTLVYGVYDAADSATAYAAVMSAAPGAWYGYWRQGSSGKSLGNNVWQVRVKYGSKQLPEDTDDKDDPVASLEINVTTRGGTAHIDHSLQTVSQYPRVANTEIDYNTAINVLDSGDRVEIRGTDIIVPQLEYNVARYFSRWDVHPTYLKTLYELTGTKNDAPFYGMATGEVLFMGADLQLEGVDLVRATFYFGGQPNETGLSVDEITGIAKDGWDYAWTSFKETVDRYLGKVMRPHQVNVEQVYAEGDFSRLNVYLHNCYGYFRWNDGTSAWVLKDETQCSATPTAPVPAGDWDGQVKTVQCTCGVS